MCVCVCVCVCVFVCVCMRVYARGARVMHAESGLVGVSKGRCGSGKPDKGGAVGTYDGKIVRNGLIGTTSIGNITRKEETDPNKKG